MSTTRRKTHTRRQWLAVSLLISCVLGGGCVPLSSPVIVIPDSEQVIYAEPNVPVLAPWPAVIISRGRYLELVEAEMLAISHGLR